MNCHVVIGTVTAAVLAFGLLSVDDAAGDVPQTQIVAFGDSLCDTGRADTLSRAFREWLKTQDVRPDLLPPVIPGPHYFEGRFSNGPIWIEFFAEKLELAPPLPFEWAGGTNFAVGGALTATVIDEATGLSVSPHPAIVQMDEQVAQYITTLGGHDPGDDLFVVWGGANDLLFPFSQSAWFAPDEGWPLEPHTSLAVQAARNIGDHIRTLYNSGARHFIVPNLPLLGTTTPFGRLAPDETTRELDQLTRVFNNKLAAQLNVLNARNPDINIIRLDVARLLEEMRADPGSFGLTNVDDFAAFLADDEGNLLGPLQPGATEADGQLFVLPGVEGFMFWDPVHITVTTHQFIAQEAVRTLKHALSGAGPTDPIEVIIDVNPGNEGVLQVAILSDEDFDASLVDELTITLGDPELVGVAAPISAAEEKVNGFSNLVLYFSVQELLDQGAIDEQTVELLLSGNTFDELVIFGLDNVAISP